MPKIYSVESKDGSDSSELQRVQIDLSPTLLALIVSIIALMFWGKQFISILLFLLFSFVLMCAMRPVVNWFLKKKMSKNVAIFLSYFSLLVFLLVILAIIFVPFVNQIGGFFEALPEWISKLLSSINGLNINGLKIDSSSIEKSVSDWVGSLTTSANVKSLTTTLGGFFSGFTTLLSATVFSIYLVSEHDSLVDIIFVKIRSKDRVQRVKQLIFDVENKLGGWILGQGTVSLIATLVSVVLLSLFKVPFAIPLAVFVGLMDAIPSIGATLGGIAVGIVSLITLGPLNAFIILILMIVYQQIENNFIIPKVMGNVVGVKPFYVMAGVVIMLIIAGPLGAVVAVPIIVLIKILYEFYIDLQKIEAKGIVN